MLYVFYRDTNWRALYPQDVSCEPAEVREAREPQPAGPREGRVRAGPGALQATPLGNLGGRDL